jgi:hypothetical protein
MKKGFSIILLSIFLLSGKQLECQTFENAFIKFDRQLNNGNGYSFDNNLMGNLAWGESYVMMAYLKMYRATKNTVFLKKVITHSIRVMSERDDRQGRFDYRNKSEAVWSAANPSYTLNAEPYAFIVHSGMITYPMADLAQLIINTPDLQDEISEEGKSFLDIAEWLVLEISLTVAAHEDQWDQKSGTYRFRNSPILEYGSEILPFNQSTALGRTLLMMYKATQNEHYLDKARQIAIHFKSALNYDEQTDSYRWKYSVKEKEEIEDISHAAIELDFARLCYQNDLIFEEINLKRFANTFLEKIYLEP